MSFEEEGLGQELTDLVVRATETSRDEGSRREDADQSARDAIAMVQGKILDALRGEPLRGLPNLGDSVYGLRIELEGSFAAKLPPGRHVLILDAHGQIGLALRYGMVVHVQTPPPAAFVRASVLTPYLEVVARALRGHLAAMERRGLDYEKVCQLAQRVTAVLA